MKLTKTRVEGFQLPATGEAFYWDEETRGFGVRVSANGKRSYIAQGRVQGKSRRITLGPHGIITCDEARLRAKVALLAMHDGIDPQEEKRREVALTTTLREVMNDYVKNKKTKHGPLKASSKADIERHVTKNFEAWADKPVVLITRDACLKRFRELSARAPSQANQAFVILRALLNWARDTHATDQDEYPLLAINPVARMFKLEKMNPETPRETRIPNDKIGAVWSMLLERRKDARTVDERTSADIVAFLLLTGARRGEAETLTWDKVNIEEGWWHLPKEKAKNHNPVTFPLSAAALELLAERPHREGNNFVFQSWGKSGHIKDARGTMEKVSEVAGLHLSHHDLRRTFTNVAIKCGIEIYKIELLTNHVPKSVTERHYMETSDLRENCAAEIQNIGAWIVTQGRIAAAVAAGENVIALRA